MKTYLKLATLAMVLIAPAGVYAADSVGSPIGNHQEAQQEPQRILDPVEFFDKKTGKVKVWYWRAESGYEFYDGPGFHPRTGEALTGVTLDVVTEWQQSQKNAKQCYIIQRDARAPVIYRDNLPGMDPETGRECRLVTTGLIERLKEYAEGKRPGRIKAPPPEFFDPRTSEPIVWYVDHEGAIEIFDLLGYHPETGEELLPVTPEIVDRWKAQQAQASEKATRPRRPRTHPFFDPKTGSRTFGTLQGRMARSNSLTARASTRGRARLSQRSRTTSPASDFDIKRREEDAIKTKQKGGGRSAKTTKSRADEELNNKTAPKSANKKKNNGRSAKTTGAAASAICLVVRRACCNPNDQNRRTIAGVSYDQLGTHIAQAITLASWLPRIEGSYFQVPAGEGCGIGRPCQRASHARPTR